MSPLLFPFFAFSSGIVSFSGDLQQLMDHLGLEGGGQVCQSKEGHPAEREGVGLEILRPSPLDSPLVSSPPPYPLLPHIHPDTSKTNEQKQLKIKTHNLNCLYLRNFHGETAQ